MRWIVDGVRAIYPLILLVLVWEAVARMGLVRPLFLPPFSAVLKQLYITTVQGELLPPLLTSLYRTAAGLMLAMAVGLPIVSFDLRETRVSAGDAALYATPNDVQAFAAGIARLLDDPTERQRRGAIGHQRVTNSLGWKESSASLIAGYERVVAGALPTRGNGGSDAHTD